MAGFEVEGMEELEDLLSDMTLDVADEKSAMKAAIEPMKQELEKNTPVDTGDMKDGLKTSVRQTKEGIVGEVKIQSFHVLFQEFGTSQQQANVGFYDRSINSTYQEGLNILAKQLLKR